MTRDTERALEIIAPLADQIGVNVSADDDILYLNDIGVGIGCNSTWATVFEFIGYLIVEYNREFRSINLSSKQFRAIQRCWYTPELLEKVRQSKTEGR